MKLKPVDFIFYDVVFTPIAITCYDLSIVYTNKTYKNEFPSQTTNLQELLCSSRNIDFQHFLSDLSKNDYTLFIDCTLKITFSKITLEENNQETYALLATINKLQSTTLFPDSDIEFILLSEQGEILSQNKAAKENLIALRQLETSETLKSRIMKEGKVAEYTCFIDNYLFSQKMEEDSKEFWYNISVRKTMEGYFLQCNNITESESIRQELMSCTKRIKTTSVFISNLAHGRKFFFLYSLIIIFLEY